MELTNMKLSTEEKKEMAPTVAADSPQYPYGLRISLESEALDKLGMKSMPATGSELQLTAVVRVKGSSTNDTERAGERKSLDLQITDLALAPVPKKQSDSETFYGKK